jgi:hypothetical protein
MDAFHHNGWLGPKTLFSTQAFHFKKKSILGKENEEEELSRESGPSEHFLDKDVPPIPFFKRRNLVPILSRSLHYSSCFVSL